MKRFLAAIRFLTILPLPGDWGAAESDLAASVPFFPVVGLLLGGLAAAIAWAAAASRPADGRRRGDCCRDAELLRMSALGRPVGHGRRIPELPRPSADAGDHEGQPCGSDGSDRRGVRAPVEVRLAGVAGAGKALARRLAHAPGRACGDLRPPALRPAARGLGAVFYAANVIDRESAGEGQRPAGADQSQPSGSSYWPAALPPYTGRRVGAAALAIALLAATGWAALGVRSLAPVAASLAVALLLAAYVHGKLGGATGDTLGAACEIVEVVPALTLTLHLLR